MIYNSDLTVFQGLAGQPHIKSTHVPAAGTGSKTFHQESQTFSG